MEAGYSSQLSSLIRVLRALDGVPGMDSMPPEAGPRPMDLLKRKGKQRQRASGQRSAKPSGSPWTWDEDK